MINYEDFLKVGEEAGAKCRYNSTAIKLNVFKVPLGPEFWYSMFLHFRTKFVVLSHHAKFQLITTNRSHFFRTVFVETLRPPLLALVPEAGLRRQRLTSNLVLHIGYLPREIKLSSRKDFLPSVQGLHGFEIFLAAAVMTGSNYVVRIGNRMISSAIWNK